MQPGRIRATTDDELKRFVGIIELGVAGLPTAGSTPSELDELASALVSLLESAAKAAGRPTRKGHVLLPGGRKSVPAPLRHFVQSDDSTLSASIRRSKSPKGTSIAWSVGLKVYWRNLIDSFSDSSAVFKAVRWLRSPGAFQPPPLQVGDVVHETQMDKANALRRATLE